MSPLHRTTADPVRLLRWRGRQSWRRVARQIVAQHVDETLSRLAEFRGLPIYDVTTSAAGVVQAVLPGWAISVTGVAPSARTREGTDGSGGLRWTTSSRVVAAEPRSSGRAWLWPLSKVVVPGSPRLT